MFFFTLFFYLFHSFIKVDEVKCLNFRISSKIQFWNKHVIAPLGSIVSFYWPSAANAPAAQHRKARPALICCPEPQWLCALPAEHTDALGHGSVTRQVWCAGSSLCLKEGFLAPRLAQPPSAHKQHLCCFALLGGCLCLMDCFVVNRYFPYCVN